MAAREKEREPRSVSLLASLALHALAGLSIAVSSWWWSPPTLEAGKTQIVSLVDAPLSLQQPSSVPPRAVPKTAIPSEGATNTPAPAQSESAPKPEAKTPGSKPEPAPKTEVKPPTPPKPEPAPKTEVKPSASAKKLKVAEPVAKPKAEPEKRTPAEPAQAPEKASSREARSAIEALRERQSKRAQEQRQVETQRQQAASDRVAALRDQLKQEEAVGAAAVAAAGVQRVRLMAYQDRVRAKIIETWIVPLSAEKTRDLQATAQFYVRRNGEVVQLELVKPSGNTLFDASLLRAIQRASPLPALPDDYPLDILEVEMRFRADA